jgi:F-type H+-transporting ATPase subunit a
MTSFRSVAFALSVAFGLVLSGAGPRLAAQEPAGGRAAAREAAAHVAEGGRVPRSAGEAHVDFITPHITDSHELEVPYWKAPYHQEVALPRWRPVHIGGRVVDLSPTKHVVMLLLAALLCVVTLLTAAAAHGRHSTRAGSPRGFAAGMEAVVLYLRNEVILPNVGAHGDAYVPFCLTLFFFILFANLLGLIPYGSTATGNIAVTAMLALITFVVVEISGMRALGKGYLKTIIYWPDDVSLGVKLFMTPIMTPVEIIGKFTKPFALAIRLFANMTAGHVVLLALISIIFTFGSYYVVAAPVLMGVAVSLLEIFVGFLQAFIFMLLSSVFIGLIRAGHE